jgi:1-pyrroline-5-carboxylate dehydrogenase
VVVVDERLFSLCQVRFLAQASSMPGDHPGQSSHAYRFPYGPVAIVTPFNFPLEIPALQLMGALYMGNHPLLKVDEKVAVVMDQFMRLLHRCGLPLEDVDMVQCSGETMHALLLEADPRCTLFTGSSRVADILARDLKGKVKLEGSGFDWKVLGPDVPDAAGQEYIAHVCDQDAHACSGQKCSAQSLLVVHRNWADAGLYGRLGAMAAQRSLHDLTVGPTLSVSTATVKAHVAKLLALPGAELLWGGEELNGGQHNIPAQFGAMQPTAVRVPIEAVLANIHLCCTELFAPFQVVTEYTDEQLPLVLQLLEAQEEHLTAAVVSNDLVFQHEVLSKTTNGTTYVGLRARTTGAPQNHWFGPAGDPRAAGIGTADAIRQTWSCHREIIQDFAAVDKGWALPART